MHCPEMRRALDRMIRSDTDFAVADSQIEVLGREFEERVNEARELVLKWG